MEKKETVFVVGHKNPDTDSICSAICYSRLKNLVDGDKVYEPRRAGEINEETKFVLDYFQVDAPNILDDVRTQVKDMEIRRTKGVSGNISLKDAWAKMQKEGLVTLTVVHKKAVAGLITVTDITKTYMDLYDNRVLANAQTPVKNIAETLDGEVVIGNEKAVIHAGKVLVAAANPDLMEDYIEKNDVVILGNRYESQLCAIEMEAAVIVICEGASPSRTICKMAEERNCIIIKTPYDTFTVARMINQSMPVSSIMKKDNLITFNVDEYTEDIRDVMAKVRHRDFPVLSEEGVYQGTISRRNLLGAKRKQLILVDHNEAAQAVNGVEDAEILEIVDHHRLGTIETMAPVFFRNQPWGCTGTIIYHMYKEAGLMPDPETAGLLCSAILSDTLLFRSPTCTKVDEIAGRELAKLAGIDPESFAMDMFRAGSDLSGKTPEQIFYQDFKQFHVEGVRMGVGQINSLSIGELGRIGEVMLEKIQEERKNLSLDMVFFMLTDILEQSTILLTCGEGAIALIERAFQSEPVDGIFHLHGVVSRKKQFVPVISVALQEK